MKKHIILIAISLVTLLSACAPTTLVRTNLAADFTREAVNREGMLVAEVQIDQPYELINQARRNQLDTKIMTNLKTVFGDGLENQNEMFEQLANEGLDGEFLAALNEYKITGRLRTDSLDRTLEALDRRYLTMIRTQYLQAIKLGSEWLFFPTVESTATISLGIYDKVNRRLVTEIITNGFAKKGVFGGGLVDTALDNAVSTALSVLKSRVQ